MSKKSTQIVSRLGARKYAQRHSRNTRAKAAIRASTPSVRNSGKNADPIAIELVNISASEQIGVCTLTINYEQFVNVQRYQKASNASWYPAREGVWLPVSKVGELVRALKQVESTAEGLVS